MTSDSISKRDWDQVHELSVQIVNASLMKDEVLDSTYIEELFNFLDELEKKYGPLPSILATRGDFTSDPLESIGYLEKAYSRALEINDQFNQLHITSSLVGKCFETEQYNESLKWIKICEKVLNKYPGECEKVELQEIKDNIKKMLK